MAICGHPWKRVSAGLLPSLHKLCYITPMRGDHMREIPAPRVNSNKSMPEVMADTTAYIRAVTKDNGGPVSPCFTVDFDVSGGWGYSREEACRIELDDSDYENYHEATRNNVKHSDGLALEGLFFERRVYEEIIYNRLPDTPDLHCLRWSVQSQTLYQENGRYYDKIEYIVSGFLEEDLEFLKNDMLDCQNRNDEEGIENNLKMAEDRKIIYSTTIWFDITSFY